MRTPVQPGETFTYRFKVPDAGSYWYHPHVNSAVQVERGLYGPIAVFDPRDPVYDVERFLVLDDIRLDSRGAIAPESAMDGMMGGRFGNTLLTNGRVAKEVVDAVEQGTVERWRIVNTANARTMKLGVEGASFRVVATDGGLLPEPYVTKRLTVAVGQRYDLEVTYDQPGTAKLLNYVEAQDDAGHVEEVAMPSFSVEVAESARVPRTIEWPSVTLPDREPDASATMTFGVRQDERRMTEWTINGEAMPEEPFFTWSQGSTVAIKLVNKVQTEHPFHLHGQFFEVLDDDQPGLKDVVLVPPGGSVNIRAYVDNPGRWMAHCHILEHAELGMMGDIVVTPTPGATGPDNAAPNSRRPLEDASSASTVDADDPVRILPRGGADAALGVLDDEGPLGRRAEPPLAQVAKSSVPSCRLACVPRHHHHPRARARARRSGRLPERRLRVGTDGGFRPSAAVIARSRGPGRRRVRGGTTDRVP